MTKLIIIPEETLDTLYERTALYLREKFSLPSTFSQNVENMPYYEDVEHTGDKPIGKVIG